MDVYKECIAIKFCFKAGILATETLSILQKGYRNDFLKRTAMYTYSSIVVFAMAENW